MSDEVPPKKKMIKIWNSEKGRVEEYDPNPGFFGRIAEAASPSTSQSGLTEAIRRRKERKP